jgi:hypothetical protein
MDSGSDSDGDGLHAPSAAQPAQRVSTFSSRPAQTPASSAAPGANAAGGEPRSLTRKEKRALKSKHRKINKEHPEFELTYDMMLGIRTVVGSNPAGHTLSVNTVAAGAANGIHTDGGVGVNGAAATAVAAAADAAKRKRDSMVLSASAADAPRMLKLSFPGRGSTLTPAHAMRDFKFKDYCGDIFRSIRARFRIDPTEYLLCVCGNFQYLEFISNSKSGQFFFYSHDKQYMIKTISGEECKFLRTILPSYLQHVQSNPHTLLTRFYGMHRVKVSSGI